MNKSSNDGYDKRQRNDKNRIPHLEWLFGYGEKSKNKGDGFLHKLLSKSWLMVLGTTLLYAFQASPMWLMPVVTSDVIDLITYQPDGFTTRLVIDAVILLVLLIQNIPMCAWRSEILNRWIRSTTAGIKAGVIRKLQRMSITYHKEMEEGRIQSKFLRDIENVEGYYRYFMTSLVPNILGVVVSTIIALLKSPIVMLFFLAIIPLNVLLMKVFQKRIRKDNKMYRQENEKLSTKLTTTLQMLTLTKAHGLVEKQEYIINNGIDEVKDAGIKADRTIAVFGAFMWVSNMLMSAVCLFFCVFLALQNIITPGEVVLFQSLFTTLSSSVLALTNAYPSLSVGKEAVSSLSEIVCADDIEYDKGNYAINKVDGKVDFENVSYRYPGDSKDVIKNFNLSVRRGERIAIVGSSGSGKSTIMNLMIGLLLPTQGRILIDGIEMTDLPLQNYRKFISVVPQNSILFSGTIRQNITYGLDNYSEQQLMQVIKDADIEEFLPSLPNGIDSQVGEHGDKLSGGQKQRISIARALIRDPRILIMDEATSALDNVAEYHVQKAIDRLVHDRTTFIVAHRLSTIRNADRIVVMDDGEMVELGTYDELMALGGKFSELEKLSRMREEVPDEAV